MPDAITAPGTPAPKRKRRRRTGERILRVAVFLAALTLVGAGSVYGYLRLRLGQIHSIKCKVCMAVADENPLSPVLEEAQVLRMIGRHDVGHGRGFVGHVFRF